MAEKELLTECVCYFKERSVYKKLFGKVCEKYHSLGHLGGSVTMTGLTKEEKRTDTIPQRGIEQPELCPRCIAADEPKHPGRGRIW